VAGGDKRDEVGEYWDEQAASFDDAPDHGLRDPAIRAAWRELLLPVMPPLPARIADLGCGTGSLAVLLAGAGYRVSGLDLAPRMVERARAKARAAAVEADFEVADAMAPPWPPGTFDVVLARHVLWALPDPGEGLDRWLALLRPGGRLILVEGRWWTGAGIESREVLNLLEARGRATSLTPLTDGALWGLAVDDERYLVVSDPCGGQATSSADR
jgi:SAM-dependent methyltransferase